MRPGDALPELTATADPTAMKTMAALLRDPNMIHLDPAVSESLGLGRRVVNQGPISMGWVHTMLARAAGGSDRVLACRTRFLGPVFGGERVRAGGTVTGLTDGCARSTAGEERVCADGCGEIAECTVWLDVLRPDGPERVLSGTARLSPPAVKG